MQATAQKSQERLHERLRVQERATLLGRIGWRLHYASHGERIAADRDDGWAGSFASNTRWAEHDKGYRMAA